MSTWNGIPIVLRGFNEENHVFHLATLHVYELLQLSEIYSLKKLVQAAQLILKTHVLRANRTNLLVNLCLV